MRVSDAISTWTAAWCATLVFALIAGASAQDSSPPGNKLGAWVGHWKVRIETNETQFGHASTEDYDAKCSSLLHGAFVACEYLGLQPDPDSGRIIKDVALLYYRWAARRLHGCRGERLDQTV